MGVDSSFSDRGRYKEWTTSPESRSITGKGSESGDDVTQNFPKQSEDRKRALLIKGITCACVAGCTALCASTSFLSRHCIRAVLVNTVLVSKGRVGGRVGDWA